MILTGISCPVCNTFTMIMLDDTLLHSEQEQEQYFKCGACDFEETLRIKLIENED